MAAVALFEPLLCTCLEAASCADLFSVSTIAGKPLDFVAQDMALTATQWSPGPHEAGAGFASQRLSLDGQSPPAQPSCGATGSLDSSQLEGLYSAFTQGLQLQGALSHLWHHACMSRAFASDTHIAACAGVAQLDAYAGLALHATDWQLTFTISQYTGAGAQQALSSSVPAAGPQSSATNLTAVRPTLRSGR